MTATNRYLQYLNAFNGMPAIQPSVPGDLTELDLWLLSNEFPSQPTNLGSHLSKSAPQLSDGCDPFDQDSFDIQSLSTPASRRGSAETLYEEVTSPCRRRSAPDRSFPCTMPNCHKVYGSGAGLRYHLKHVHRTITDRAAKIKAKPKIVSCPKCPGKTFSTKAGLRYHENTVHKAPMTPEQTPFQGTAMVLQDSPLPMIPMTLEDIPFNEVDMTPYYPMPIIPMSPEDALLHEIAMQHPALPMLPPPSTHFKFEHPPMPSHAYSGAKPLYDPLIWSVQDLWDLDLELALAMCPA